ncbi:MAG TPA: SRPBCC family protein [Acidimicrobiales bacterium]|nr:SRPBCC family protein [Acidimicrobiales bacterium]
MPRYATTIPSPWSVDEAFSYMSDFANARLWDPSVVAARRIDEGEVAPDSQFDLTVRFAGRDKILRYRVTSLEPPRIVTFTSSTGTLVSTDTLTFERRARGCEMTYSAELRFQGVAAMANPLLGLLFRRLGDRARESLREILGSPREAA